MAWRETASGLVITEAAADYLHTLFARGMVWTEVSELPCEVRERLVALYMEGIGRPPTDTELTELLSFAVG
jgi:hypothetical protein